MATYAIGDVQGCFQPFLRLLRRIDFTPGVDRLWLTGDVVNRGRGSLATLRWLVDHDRDVVSVLGNHDLHLLAVADGVAPLRGRDTLRGILEASDRDDLLAWLGRRPLAHAEADYLLVHAGLLPSWSGARVMELAGEAEVALRGPERGAFLAAARASRPSWSDAMPLEERRLATTRILTTVRALDAEGQPLSGYDGPPEAAPPGATPWFLAHGRASAELTVIFGHWAALGLWLEDRVLALDSGCVWGGHLTAVRLEDRAVFSVPARSG